MRWPFPPRRPKPDPQPDRSTTHPRAWAHLPALPTTVDQRPPVSSPLFEPPSIATTRSLLDRPQPPVGEPPTQGRVTGLATAVQLIHPAPEPAPRTAVRPLPRGDSLTRAVDAYVGEPTEPEIPYRTSSFNRLLAQFDGAPDALAQAAMLALGGGLSSEAMAPPLGLPSTPPPEPQAPPPTRPQTLRRPTLAQSRRLGLAAHPAPTTTEPDSPGASESVAQPFAAPSPPATRPPSPASGLPSGERALAESTPPEAPAFPAPTGPPNAGAPSRPRSEERWLAETPPAAAHQPPAFPEPGPPNPAAAGEPRSGQPARAESTRPPAPLVAPEPHAVPEPTQPPNPAVGQPTQTASPQPPARLAAPEPHAVREPAQPPNPAATSEPAHPAWARPPDPPSLAAPEPPAVPDPARPANPAHTASTRPAPAPLVSPQPAEPARQRDLAGTEPAPSEPPVRAELVDRAAPVPELPALVEPSHSAEPPALAELAGRMDSLAAPELATEVEPAPPSVAPPDSPPPESREPLAPARPPIPAEPTARPAEPSTAPIEPVAVRRSPEPLQPRSAASLIDRPVDPGSRPVPRRLGLGEPLSAAPRRPAPTPEPDQRGEERLPVYRAVLPDLPPAPAASQPTAIARVPAEVADAFRGRFGVDVAEVPVHRGAPVAAAARSVSARAFTQRGEVYLPDGGDRGLLAHELVHAVQQRALGSALPAENSVAGARLEASAVAAEDWFLGRGSAPDVLVHPASALDPPAESPFVQRATELTQPETFADPASITLLATESGVRVLPPEPATVVEPGIEELRARMDQLASAVEELATQQAARPDLGDPHDFDGLVARFYQRIRGGLRRELLVDRERAGLLTDLRWE